MRLRSGSGIFMRVGVFSFLFVMPALEEGEGEGEEFRGETSLAIGLGDFLKQGYLSWLSPSMGKIYMPVARNFSFSELFR